METWKNLRINERRLLSNFEGMSRIGSTGDGGVNRPTFSAAHLEARAFFQRMVEDAGLEFRQDGVGNCSAFLPCGPRDAPVLLLGSHRDSVFNGGCFDGALGVLAGLEVLCVVQENELSLPVNLEAIDFTDEEGTLVGGTVGSKAVAGTLKPDALGHPAAGREELEAGFKRAGLSEMGIFTARRDPATISGYLELHIEQGQNLFQQLVDIGVVTAIVGMRSYRVTYTGQANHAGTTSMKSRLDAGQGASALNLAARELVLSHFPGCVVNVGQMVFSPGGINIIPETAVLSLEFRSPDSVQMEELDNALKDLTRKQAQRFGLGIEIEFLSDSPAAPMNKDVQRMIAEMAISLGLTHISLPSGAGHDAQNLAPVCPTGMIFVPSIDGISHSPMEFTRQEDCINGANVLLQAALRLATG
ncbi:MAG: Zn-dependent hydrolase [Anaerolineaceae bacterium]|nr:Zn-dependent hydrolase [Anaerolineaceae bacterium]